MTGCPEGYAIAIFFAGSIVGALVFGVLNVIVAFSATRKTSPPDLRKEL